MRNISLPLRAFALCLLGSLTLFAQGKLTSPKEHFGFAIGDDYQLANYTQYEAYLKKLDAESDRLKVVEMGKSAEGRTMYLAIVTTPENHKNLDRYRDISRRLTLAEGLADDEAKRLAKEGKAIVWIDGGLHANEVLGAQQLIETLWMLVSGTDEEVTRFLNDDIALLCLVNPDGMELVSNWYMRESDPLKRSTGNLPRLYQKYIGHDNNRDFYLSSQPESEAINRVFFHEWFPQIVYNHHQTGPIGTVMFAPPFRDPFNYNYDPLIPLGVDIVGAAMHSRFAAEGKPGVTMRSGSSYSTWWNGGLRTTVYFHNMIGLLTETIGNPTPMDIPLVLSKQLPKADLPFPIAPQKWHFRQSIEYSLTANRAVLDVAARQRDTFLYRAYQMGKNSIERGSRDTWTITPHEVAEQQAAAAKERSNENADGPRFERAIGFERPANSKYFNAMRTPDKRDPRGFIMSADQADFLTAIKFVNTLIKTGITVHRATAGFTVNGKSYPAGSLVVKTAQAFRPHVLDMFEPQDHPNDFAYPGGPPLPPYDSAGWTLAMQMGVQFDRILDGFEGPFEKVSGFVKPASGKFMANVGGAAPAGFVTSHAVNDSFIATAKLLASGEDVYWLKDAQGGRPAGTIFIPFKAGTAAKLQKLAGELGLNFEAAATKPTGEMLKLKQPRIALFDRYGGSMPSGWTRWLLEQFQIPFTVVYPQTLDAGDLKSKFDVIIFVTGSIPAAGGRGAGGGGGFGGDAEPGGGGQGPRADSIPDEFKGWLGNVTTAKTVPQLKAFVEAGGALLAIGSSTSMGFHANLPIANALVERQPDGSERALSRDKFYIPGSLLQVSVDNTNPLAYGLPAKLDVYYDNSPSFRLKPDAPLKGTNAVAWFDSDKPLRSGWAWGQKYLQDSAAVIEATVGKGKLFLYGPEINFRAQPHGTFKFLFNGIYYGTAELVK